MANKRMVSKSISISLSANKLDNFSALLFTWMIPHADDFGILPGEPEQIKALVIPLRKESAKDVEKALLKMATESLIWWYEAYGKKYIQFKTWEKHQEGLHKRTIPKNPLFEDASQTFPEIPGNSLLIEQNRTEQNNVSLTSAEIPVEDGRSATKVGKSLDEQFKEFWDVYPRKTDRGAAFLKWKARIQEGVSPADIVAAAVNYASYCRTGKTEQRFIKHGATFLGPSKTYEEYIDFVPQPPDGPEGRDKINWLTST